MSDTIITRAPTRIDFGGGWTDVPPYADEVGGFVCNIAIDRYATVTVGGAPPAATDVNANANANANAADQSIVRAVARRFHMFDVPTAIESNFPVGAGLGGSSAAGVAAVAAFAAMRGEVMKPTAIAELSRDIETADLHVPGGRQDHYASAYGGALGLRFSHGKVDVKPILLGAKARTEIERRCIIVYTGQSRVSGETIEAVMGAYRARDAGVLSSLQNMRMLAERMPEALASANLDLLGRLVNEQWTHQRALHETIPTQLIDDILARGREAGSVGGKALGASGGGCVLVIARQDRVAQVRDAVAPLGEIISFHIAQDGVERCA